MKIFYPLCPPCEGGEREETFGYSYAALGNKGM